MRVVKMETVMLSDLGDNEIVCLKNGKCRMTGAELKERILENPNSVEGMWYVLKPEAWEADAKDMLKTYIEKESKNMYTGWKDNAMDTVTDDVLQKLQSVLDETFNTQQVKTNWKLSKRIYI